MSVESLKVTSGEATEHSPARAAATTGLDESKRGERDTWEAEAAGLHTVPLSVWPVTNVLQRLDRRCRQHRYLYRQRSPATQRAKKGFLLATAIGFPACFQTSFGPRAPEPGDRAEVLPVP